MNKVVVGFAGIGTVLVSVSVFLNVYSNIKYNNIIDSFENDSSSLAQLEALRDESLNKKDYITESAIGLLKIPDLDIKYPIVEGISDKSLRYAIGHFPETPTPDEEGNCTIIGHNNFILSEPFKNLYKIEEDTIVTVVTHTNSYDYKVTKIERTTPYDKTVVAQNKEVKTLTMITCTSNAQERLVVEAEFVGLTPEEPKTEE